ncbi:MAG: class I SAM-dependent methyltransferase [Chloroflexota bacterium]|nr:class I SAM-dependent methyltransferase [Chloroflexota bacterium]
MITKQSRQLTSITRSRYQRIAPFYDLIETLPEKFYTSWRRRLWPLVQGPDVLEVGVGTGKNMPYYPHDIRITAIDLAPGMLERARIRAQELELDVDLGLGDVQSLDFPDASFNTVVATFDPLTLKKG